MVDLFHVMGFICLTGHKIDMVFDDDDYEKKSLLMVKPPVSSQQ